MEKNFRVTDWPCVRGIHRSPVNSPHKGQWRGALMFSLICAWTNNGAINGDASDLRRHRAHYDVTVMICSDDLQPGNLPQRSEIEVWLVKLDVSKGVATIHKNALYLAFLLRPEYSKRIGQYQGCWSAMALTLSHWRVPLFWEEVFQLRVPSSC